MVTPGICYLELAKIALDSDLNALIETLEWVAVCLSESQFLGILPFMSVEN